MYKNIKILFFSLFALLSISLVAHSNGLDTGYYNWNGLGDGLGPDAYGDEVAAITTFNGNIIAGGSFTTSGSNTINRIAQWGGNTWQSLGSGVNGEVYALVVFNNELYAGGSFTMAGSVSANHIAKWNGSSWSAVGAGINGEVKALVVYNNQLIAGGEFNSPGSNIAKWDGANWSQLGSGVNMQGVLALTVFNTDLIAAGRFGQAGGVNADKIAKWNGSSWSAISSASFDDRIHAVGVYNNKLVAGGRFQSVTGSSAQYIAIFDGTTWQKVGNGIDRRVLAITTYKGDLVVGGQLRDAYNPSGTFYVNRIALWNGSIWQKIGSGMGDNVSALAVKDSSLIAGGEFRTAGGFYAKRIAEWKKRQMYIVSGVVRYANNLPVAQGKVYSVRLDLNTRQYVKDDSVTIQPNGRYSINIASGDKRLIITAPNDELDYIPTYFPQSIDWEQAIPVQPFNNIDSINIKVAQVENTARGTGNISGVAGLNFVPVGYPNSTGFYYQSNAIVYATQGGIYKGFSISNVNEEYSIPSLADGSYHLKINRLGYETEEADITVTGGVATQNFLLDTVAYTVSVENISNITPRNFELYQNYPNPFNPATKIKFDLLKNSRVSLTIFDIAGRETAKLINNEFKASGSYEVQFKALNLPSGAYFYRLETFEEGSASASFAQTKKMMLIK